MKKSFCLLCILIFSCALITGCKKKQANADAVENETSEVLKNTGSTVVAASDSDEVFASSSSAIAVNAEKSNVLSNEPVSSEQNTAEPEEIASAITETNEFTQTAGLYEANIAQLEEKLSDSELDIKTPEEKKESEELYVVDNKGNLKLFSFEEEILIPQEDKGYKVLISANKKIVERKYYDQHNRFVKKEEWSIPDVKNARLLKTQIYEYAENSYEPKSKIIHKDNTRSYISYNEFSKPIENKEYFVYKDEKSETEKEYICSETLYEYDQKNHLILQKEKEYEYSDDTYKTVKNILTRELAYKHIQEELPPDYEYYENEILRLSKKYSNIPGNYIEQVFFDEGYSVKTIYKNNFKVKEIYTLNGVTVREMDYE